jgi:hypothetical protein
MGAADLLIYMLIQMLLLGPILKEHHKIGHLVKMVSLTLPANGTISGLKDVNITGNLTVVGTTTYANTQTVLIADNILTLNAAIGQAAQPLVNAGIEVDRGAQPNAQFLWIETAGKWSANNGNGSFYIAADSAESYANAAFAAANAANAAATQNNSITAAFIQLMRPLQLLMLLVVQFKVIQLLLVQTQ